MPGRDPARGARGTGRDAVTDGDGMEQVMLEMGSQDLEKFGRFGFVPENRLEMGSQRS